MSVGRRGIGLLAIAILLTWPQALHSASLYGAAGGEVDNHYWMYWVATQRVVVAISGHTLGPLTDVPHGWEIPLMDPINLPIWWSAAWIRPEVGYTAVLWVNLMLAGFGAGKLAMAIHARTGAGATKGSDALAFWAGAVAGMASPPLLGFMNFGIAEAWTVGWLGLHAAYLLRWGETGERRALVLAAAAAAAVWASGWYNAAFLLMLEPFLWVAARRWSLALPVAAVVAALPRLPALWETHANFALWSSRLTGICTAIPNRGWLARPFCGADLLALIRPSPEPLLVSHAMYVGLVAVGLAGFGVVRRPSRSTMALVAAIGVLWAFSLGTTLRIAGQPSPLPMPAGLATALLPQLRAITHWERAEVPAGMLLAGLVGAAVARLPRWGGIVAGLLLLVDTLGFGGQQFPRQSYATDAPAELRTLDGTGALLLIPVDNTFDAPQNRSRRPYNQWQVDFGRPVSENYEGPDDVTKYPAIKYLNYTCGVRPGPGERPPRVWDLGELRSLHDVGYDWIVVVPELARDPAACEAAVTGAFGDPQVSGRIVAWRL